MFTSLVLALGAAWIARNWVQAKLNGGAAPTEATMQVVVASMEIPFGTKLEARHLATITLPRSAQVGGHFEKPDEALGLVSLQKISASEILIREHFADHQTGSTLAAIVKPDMRAITVRVDDVVGVAGFLLPGNHVDIVAARMNSAQRAETETVLQNINVLAVDQTAAQDKDQPVVVRAVTLEMTPQQAEVLVRAREEGKIQLTLRNPLEIDVEAPPPPPVVEVAPPKPVIKKIRVEAPRPVDNSVTIIRGTNVQNANNLS